MIPEQIKYYTEWLQVKNFKAFYLAFLRVAISILLMTEVIYNWSSMDILYGNSAFVVPKSDSISWLPAGSYSYIKNHYLWFINIYLAVIFLNITGIGRRFTAVLLYCMLLVLQKMNAPFLNGGDLMARLVVLYLIFADTHQYFVLVNPKYKMGDESRLRNLVSNLAAFTIMLQLCIAYFASGIAKAMEPLWQHGEATYYALSMERFVGTPFNKYIVQHRWINLVSNYGVLLFELFFPVLVWIKTLRKPLLLTGILLHLCIYVFLMIHSFQVVFVLLYGLFLPNQGLLNCSEKLKHFFYRRRFRSTG